MQCHTPINNLALEDEDRITWGLVAVKKQKVSNPSIHCIHLVSGPHNRPDQRWLLEELILLLYSFREGPASPSPPHVFVRTPSVNGV